MSIKQPRRRARPSEFVFIERAVLEDPRLSFAAKGLYAVVAAWEEGQSSPTDESVTAVLDELVAAGYAAVGKDGETVVGWPDAADEPEPTEPRRVPKPRADTQSAGWAYAIGDATADQVKIGFTQNVEKRLKGLQTGHHADLRVLWQGAGGAAMEAHLHARFARRRIRGEWFDFAGVDAQKLIAQAAKSFRGAAQ
ncbi:GIY-YIG nuclease family protein [Streptomyces sp. NPDC088178]|uniref:GIY-YIG nuclease family protein n=1 Tax=Streptomyces sp. NPDC088178 TaxID=3365836 RepID=UPI0037F24478